ncbi:MAG: site-specific integrase [Acidobacteriota bacterium]|nr:site-specific integrase [Acidobacteriota bacterium]
MTAVRGRSARSAANHMPGFSYDPRTKTAHFDVYVDGGKGRVRRRRTVPALNAQDAKRLWAAFCDEVNGESAKSADTRALTFGAFFERHFEEVCDELAPKTKHEYELIIKRLLLPVFGDTPMSEIRARDVNAVAVKLKNGGRAGATVNGYIAVLLVLLRKAVEHDFLDEYPLRKKVIRYKVNKPENELSDDERLRFLAAFDDEAAFRARIGVTRSTGTTAMSTRFHSERRFGGGRNPASDATGALFRRFQFTRPFFEVALESGLRLSDLRALTWKQLDFDRGFLFVVTKKTKTPAAIPMSDRCRAALEVCRHRARFAEMVFVDESGNALPLTRIRRAFAIAKALAEITRTVRIHDLRHTFGSRLATEGVELLTISRVMAHKDIATTQRYARLQLRAFERVRAALNGS